MSDLRRIGSGINKHNLDALLVFREALVVVAAGRGEECQDNQQEPHSFHLNHDSRSA